MKNILVPVDFSQQSLVAFQFAKHIAKKAKATITLLNIIEPYMPFNEMGHLAAEQDYISHLKDAATDYLQKIAENDEIEVNALVQVGSIFRLIREHIDENKIDLVVMGTQGASGLEEVFIGSNTEKIVRTSDCPVLTVRNAPQDFEVKELVFATNLRDEQTKLIAMLKNFQAFFGAHLHLVYVNTPNGFLSSQEIRDQSNAFISKAKLENYTFHVESDINEEMGVIQAAQNLNADMIAMGTHQRKGLAHWFVGSITEDVVNHADRPVLTLGLKK